MDRRRLIVIGIAGIAAIAAIFLMRAVLGGGTPKVSAAPAPQVETVKVLVAASVLTPGTKITADKVRWQEWPRTSLDASFLTEATVPDIAAYSEKSVVRAPLVAGEPLTATKVVQSDTASFMSAILTPGMRAVSVGISAETGAGGFILPNDRVDVIKTDIVSESPRRYRASTILENVRVLSIDQTSKQENAQTTYVVGKIATLELSLDQAQLIARASAGGSLSLTLRPLAVQDPHTADLKTQTGGGDISIIRYGVVSADSPLQSKE